MTQRGPHGPAVSGSASATVDVCVPTGGGRLGYLREAAESVLAQTLESWRLWICQGGEPDPALPAALGTTLGDPRVTAAATGTRLDAAANISHVLGVGEAPYVLVLHDDDRIDPDALMARARFLDAHPACGFVFSGHRDIDADGRVVGRSALAFAEGIIPGGRLRAELVRRNVIGVMHAVMMRRSALRECGAYVDPAFPHLFDWELWLRLAFRYPAGFLARHDVDYRSHAAQMSTRPRDAEEFLRVLDRAEELAARASGPPPLSARELATLRSARELACALDAIEGGRRRRARLRLRAAISRRPASALDPRFAVGVVGLALRSRGPSMARALRAWAARRASRPDLDSNQGPTP